MKQLFLRFFAFLGMMAGFFSFAVAIIDAQFFPVTHLVQNSVLGFFGFFFFFLFLYYLLPSLLIIKQEKWKWIRRTIIVTLGLSLNIYFVYFLVIETYHFGFRREETLTIITFLFTWYLLRLLTKDASPEASAQWQMLKQRWGKITKIIIVSLIILFIIYIIVARQIYVPPSPEQIATQVQKIHNTKITMDHVLGTNLPPRPKDPDKTVEGYDVNNNGIRDDIELDIFEAYPNSQKTRAVLLGYALVEQMIVKEKIKTAETANALVGENGRASGCIASITSRDNFDELYFGLHRFIEKRQENTSDRKRAINDIYKLLPNTSNYVGRECDIDLSLLPN